VIVHADITEAKRRELQLLVAKDEADSINRMKTEFLANMSHELRTPLNAIIGFSDIIESEMFGLVSVPKYLEYVSDIKQSGEHLLVVINDILDISKVESGTVVLDRDVVDSREVIETSLRLVAPHAQQKNLDLSADNTVPYRCCGEIAGASSSFSLICCRMRSNSHPMAGASRLASRSTLWVRWSYRCAIPGSAFRRDTLTKLPIRSFRWTVRWPGAMKVPASALPFARCSSNSMVAA
jgi:hypothetical protein